MSTSREDFTSTWLTEMPQGLGSFETYDGLVYHIDDLVKHGVEVQDLGNGLKKIDLSQTMYYWYDDNGVVVLGVSLDKQPQGLVVRLTGKNPQWRGKPPYSSDLYNTILRDNSGKSVRLFSDESLSDEGKALWDRMFKQGHTVSVYDRTAPGKTFKTFTSQSDMDQYFAQDDTDFKRYQYVLSETGSTLAETRSFFHMRRFREVTPGLL